MVKPWPPVRRKSVLFVKNLAQPITAVSPARDWSWAFSILFSRWSLSFLSMKLRVENVLLSLGSESFYWELRLQEKEQPMGSSILTSLQGHGHFISDQWPVLTLFSLFVNLSGTYLLSCWDWSQVIYLKPLWKTPARTLTKIIKSRLVFPSPSLSFYNFKVIAVKTIQKLSNGKFPK